MSNWSCQLKKQKIFLDIVVTHFDIDLALLFGAYLR